MRCTASKSPFEVMGNPASMMSTPRAGKLVSYIDLLLDVEGRAGRLLAISQGGIED